jgi:hypothetical protein
MKTVRLISIAALACVALASCSDDATNGSPDAGGTDASTDATGVTDAARDTGSTPDSGGPDVRADVVQDTGLPETSTEAGPVACTVRFTVSEASVEDGGAEKLYVVGSIAPLGSWNPAFGAPLTAQATAGTWTGTVSITDGTAVEFKFVKNGGAGGAVWEGGSWGFGNNRRITVRCPVGDAAAAASADADAAPVDASADAADAGADADMDAASDAMDAGADVVSKPVEGADYSGVFNQRSSDVP